MMRKLTDREMKLGHATIHIRPWSSGEASAEHANGCLYWDQRIIKIADHLSPSVEAESVLHEQLHAVWRVWNIPRGGEDDDNIEEQLVGSLSHGIATLFRDNPELMRDIIDALTGEQGAKHGKGDTKV